MTIKSISIILLFVVTSLPSAVFSSSKDAVFFYGAYRCATEWRIEKFRMTLDSPLMKTISREEYSNTAKEGLKKICMNNGEREEALNIINDALELGRDMEEFYTKRDLVFNYIRENSRPAEELTPNAWAAHNAAHKAEAFWKTLHPEAFTQVVAIRKLYDYEFYLRQSGEIGQTFGLIAFFAHVGEYDGFRFDSPSLYPLTKLPDKLIPELPPDILNKNIENNEGFWEIRQTGVVRVTLINYGTNQEFTDPIIVKELHWGEALINEGAISNILEAGGIVFIGGCKSTRTARKYMTRFVESRRKVTVIAFNNSAGLDTYVLSAFKKYFYDGTVTKGMEVYNLLGIELDLIPYLILLGRS